MRLYLIAGSIINNPQKQVVNTNLAVVILACLSVPLCRSVILQTVNNLNLRKDNAILRLVKIGRRLRFALQSA